VVWKDTRMSYGELERCSNQLASLLIDAGCPPGERVALLLPKSHLSVVGMLGAVKAGAICVPIDIGDPALRIARILELADCRWILAGGRAGPLVEEALAEARLENEPLLGWLDAAPSQNPRCIFELADLDGFSPVAPSIRKPTPLAQILFTSGSTGIPKGVTLTHEGIAHFLRWGRRHFAIDHTSRLSQHASLRFDIATFDIYGALGAGAELHVVPPELNMLPHKLAQFIRDSRLTQWLSVPAVLNMLARYDVVRYGDFPSLRTIIFAGEVLPTATLIHLMQRLPHVTFTNFYGPTETAIASSFHTLSRMPKDEREPTPIGIACDGEELRVLDGKMRPVPDGTVGELYIGGVGVSAGYWRDPQKTRATFLDDPWNKGQRIYKTGDRVYRDADGLHYFCGRSDLQIKSRGYRIELGEIEAALNTIPELLESAVVAIPSAGFEGHLICCAFAPAPGSEIRAERVRALLAERVPSFMLPAAWQRCDRLPRNGNGKIDRPLIAESFRDQADANGPADAARADPRAQAAVATVAAAG
jgi:amino acid adenylation domain-containing protein